MRHDKYLGTVDKVALGEIEFMDDSIEIWVEIKETSDNMRSRILQAVEEAKKRTEESMQCLYNRGWKETVVKCLTLHIVAKKDKTLETSVSVYFEEMDNPDVFESGYFAIDLSEHEAELKTLLIEGITSKFF